MAAKEKKRIREGDRERNPDVCRVTATTASARLCVIPEQHTSALTAADGSQTDIILNSA